MLQLPFESEPSLLQSTTAEERALCQKHFELLQDWNTRMALVSRKSIDKSFENHYADSILTSQFGHKFYKSGIVFDLGSGAGFPGVFFGIRYRSISITLFERSQKKSKFLTEVVLQLGLDNVTVQGDWQNQKLYGLFFARAVIPRDELFKFFEARISPGSTVILNSGGDADISTVPNAFKLLEANRYTLPGTAGVRQIEAVVRR